MRGWPTYEKAVSSMIKSTSYISFWDAVIVADGHGVPSTTHSSVHSGSQAKPTLQENPLRRQPPCSAARFRADLAERHFTNGADQSVVADLYERTLHGAMAQVTELAFTDCGWQNEELVQFSACAPLCASLTALDLFSNKIGNRGVHALSAALREGAMPLLQSLMLTYNCITSEGFKVRASCKRWRCALNLP